MEMQNITLSLPKQTLRKIKLVAAQRQTSISGLLREYLEDIANQESGYNRARQRQVRLMESGLDLGTSKGQLASREALHER